MTRANITDTPIKVVIADLKSKYSEIEQEKDKRQFFVKIAQYGKYILEGRSTTTILTPLYQEAKDDAKPYLKAWKDFVKVWKQYARDILKKAAEAGIKDNPNNPLVNEISSIKNHLNDKDTSVWETDLQYYYIPYMTLIWKFNNLKKSNLLVPRHLDPKNKTIVISPIYSGVRDEWDKFKVSREAKVWWAHYQICRLAAGVLDLKTGTDYFKRDNIIDGFYKYEFNELAKGNSRDNPIVLHADRYAVWIKRLHEYLLPRLQELSIQTVQKQYRPLETEMDLTDTSSRRTYEKKWDVLQTIWGVYESHSRPDGILIPVARLTIKGRDVQLIDGIVEGLRKKGLFQKWDRKDRWYNLEFINHEILPKVYQEVRNTYKKFATAYQQRRRKELDDAKEPSATKIEITKMPELQIQELKEIAKTKQRDNKPKFPHKLPAGTKWQNITIKFLNDEEIYIQVKQFKHSTNYKEIGFVGKGNNPNPSEAWTFLKVLAKVNGELTVKDTEARDKYKKQKELLAKSLQSYFSIDYDPFYPYRSSSEKSGNSYKIKITLIPPPDTKKKTNTDEDDNDDLGIKEYLGEQNPQVYEDE